MDKRQALKQDEAIEIVRRYKHEISSFFGGRIKVYMFGSYSKGNANSDSDIDVAVVVPKIDKDKWLEWSKTLWHYVDGVSMLIEPVLMEQDEQSPLYRDVMRTGIAV